MASVNSVNSSSASQQTSQDSSASTGLWTCDGKKCAQLPPNLFETLSELYTSLLKQCESNDELRKQLLSKEEELSKQYALKTNRMLPPVQSVPQEGQDLPDVCVISATRASEEAWRKAQTESLARAFPDTSKQVLSPAEQ
jgi:hypothetical protein